jgi:hypothetical protein
MSNEKIVPIIFLCIRGRVSKATEGKKEGDKTRQGAETRGRDKITRQGTETKDLKKRGKGGLCDIQATFFDMPHTRQVCPLRSFSFLLSPFSFLSSPTVWHQFV